MLWARDPDVVAAINQRHENPLFLPGIALDPAIAATADRGRDGRRRGRADRRSGAIPARRPRRMLAPLLPAGLPLLLCAKGIETGSLQDDVGNRRRNRAGLAGRGAVGPELRGRGGARPADRGDDRQPRPRARRAPSSRRSAAPRFRPYSSEDPIGAEIGGAVKNVLAIACGIIEGRGLGDNARAALITRGLAEMVRLGLAKGGRGGNLPRAVRPRRPGADLHRRRSRATTRWGWRLGRGASLGAGARRTAARSSRGSRPPRRSRDWRARLGVEMPITEAVDAVLHRGMAIDVMIDGLLRRPYRSE